MRTAEPVDTRMATGVDSVWNNTEEYWLGRNHVVPAQEDGVGLERRNDWMYSRKLWWLNFGPSADNSRYGHVGRKREGAFHWLSWWVLGRAFITERLLS
jgi:hypothetical protein